MNCNPCVWIRTAILCGIPAAAILLLWQLIGLWLIIIPLAFFVLYIVVRDATKPKRKPAGKRVEDKVVYQDANTPILCLPCGRESVTTRAAHVLVIEGHRIPCCDSHMETARERIAIGGVYRER